jgi:hypothetical protein
MSNGNFYTKGKGIIQVKFFEYSNSKTVRMQPEIVEYEITLDKPAFDLIIGTKTMNELGIILDFIAKVITINSIKLPMQSIEELPPSNIFLGRKNLVKISKNKIVY